MCSSSPSGTISSWVVIFILPINSALNPILYTLTTSFFREQVEVLLCRWQRRHTLKKDRKSLTSSTIFMETPRVPCYQLPAYFQRLSLNGADPRYAWGRRDLSVKVRGLLWNLLHDTSVSMFKQESTVELFHHALWPLTLLCPVKSSLHFPPLCIHNRSSL